MKPNSKHMEWANKILNEYHRGTERIEEVIAQHLAAFEAEVREDIAETHVDKADAWDAAIRAGKRRNPQSTKLDAFRNAIKDSEAAQPSKVIVEFRDEPPARSSSNHPRGAIRRVSVLVNDREVEGWREGSSQVDHLTGDKFDDFIQRKIQHYRKINPTAQVGFVNTRGCK